MFYAFIILAYSNIIDDIYKFIICKQNLELNKNLKRVVDFYYFLLEL
jgi:hypothetical protein